MPKYIVYTDEKITVWQRVGLVIEAESERELDEIMNEPPLFQQAMKHGRIEYNGDVDGYWETEDHADWDHNNFNIKHIVYEKAESC